MQPQFLGALDMVPLDIGNVCQFIRSELGLNWAAQFRHMSDFQVSFHTPIEMRKH